MKVTKQNYEEYALDYIEGMLSEEKKEAFDAFLQGHPEIASEIRRLQDGMPVLLADESIRFESKAALKRNSLRPWIFRGGAVAAILILGIWVVRNLQEVPIGQPDAIGDVQLAENHSIAELKMNPFAEGVPTTLDTLVPVSENNPQSVSSISSALKTSSVHSDLAKASGSAANKKRVESVHHMAVNRLEYPKLDLESTMQTAELDKMVYSLEQEMDHFETITPEQELFDEHQPPEDVVCIREQMATRAFEKKQSVRNYFAENTEQMGFLNLLKRKELKRVMAEVLTPLAELNPIKVYENKEEKVVEFASIMIRRKNLQEEQ